jgi:hypothetical protein
MTGFYKNKSSKQKIPPKGNKKKWVVGVERVAKHHLAYAKQSNEKCNES